MRNGQIDNLQLISHRPPGNNYSTRILTVIYAYHRRQYNQIARGPLCKPRQRSAVRFCFALATGCARETANAMAYNTLVALFTSVICDSSFSLPAAVLLAPLRFPPRVRPFGAAFGTAYETYEKRKQAGRKFITREQQVITLKADFSEQLFGRKERKEERTSPRNHFVVFALMAATCGR